MSTMKCKPFYLNILLLNKDEVVSSGVASKAGTGLLGRAAAFAANKLVTDEKVLSKLADSLSEGIHKAVLEMGIDCEFNVQFQQGPLVVIKVQVLEVDTMKILLAAKGPDFASNFSTLQVTANLLGMGEVVSDKVDDKIFGSVNEGMINKFCEIIPQKMSEKGISIDLTAASAETEAEVFFNLLQNLQK